MKTGGSTSLRCRGEDTDHRKIRDEKVALLNCAVTHNKANKTNGRNESREGRPGL